MNTIINEKIDMKNFEDINSKGYGKCPKLLTQDIRLTIESKSIYNYFSSYCGNGAEFAFPKLDTILYHLQISKNRYYKHLKPLTELGFIEVIKRRKKNKNGKWVSDSNLYLLKKCIYSNKDLNTNKFENEKENKSVNKKINEIKNKSEIKSENNYTNKNVNKVADDLGCDETVENTTLSELPTFEDLQNKNFINNNNNNKISMYVGIYSKYLKISNEVKEFIYKTYNKISFSLYEKILIEVLNNTKIVQKDSYFVSKINALISKNIKTLDQYKLSIKNYKEFNTKNNTLNKNNKSSNVEKSYKDKKEFKKTKFHNFTETFTNYSDEELDDIILKSQRAKFV